MAGAPISKRTSGFKKMFEDLPPGVQYIANGLYARFKEDPCHPMLHTSDLHDTRLSMHRSGSKRIKITQRYRAIYVIDNGQDGNGPPQYCWYWVGSHENCNNYTDGQG